MTFLQEKFGALQGVEGKARRTRIYKRVATRMRPGDASSFEPHAAMNDSWLAADDTRPLLFLSTIMQGTMQDYPLTLHHVLWRMEKLFSRKEVITKRANGVHRYTYADMGSRVRK